jgi:hypothetical protein
MAGKLGGDGLRGKDGGDDLVDNRGGATDPITPGEATLPEGLKRKRMGPYSNNCGRHISAKEEAQD